jgi:tetratricopeptide (TPR) repeat protein
VDSNHLVDIHAGTYEEALKAGSGYRVGQTLVLTANHNVTADDGRVLDRIDIRLGHLAAGPQVRATANRVWVARGNLDIALLRIEPRSGCEPLPVYSGPAVLWGRLQGNDRISYTGIGFPSFASFGNQERGVEQLSGELNPLSMSADGILMIDQHAYPDRPASGIERRWAGVSGASIFVTDFHGENLLIGVVVEDDDMFANRRLRICAVSMFCEDPEFRLLLVQDGQPEPRLKSIFSRSHHAQFGSMQVPRQLPMDIGGLFVGRKEELEALSDVLDAAAEDTALIAISAIGGAAGIGKSALAIHWAHQAAERFPDGQLYVNLRGFDPNSEPMVPVTAIRSFLDAFGVPPDRIPVDLAAQAALYRSVLSGKRVLLVLDNARNAEHVRPLLPGSSTCRVLITSRDRLVGLVPIGVRVITLDVLSASEAFALIARVIGSARTSEEPDAVAELIEYCARLPLALAVVAARAVERPSFPLRILAEELKQEQRRLDALDTGDPMTSIRSVFSWSYTILSPAAVRFFRLFGVTPGGGIGRYAAASLVGVELSEVRPILDELTRAHMVEEPNPGWYTSHDLLRGYAAEMATQDSTASERTEARRRILDFYLQTAFFAERQLYPQRELITLVPAVPGVITDKPVDYQEAMEWFRREHENLRAVIRHAETERLDTYVWQIAWCMSTFLDRNAHWLDYADTQRTALDAANRLGDPVVQALTHRLLATAYTHLARLQDAEQHLVEALALYANAENASGQARTYFNIAMLHEKQGHFAEAAENAVMSIAMYRSAGNPSGAARVLSWLGWYQALDGRYTEALTSSMEALQQLRELDNRWEIAHALHHVGFAYHNLGQHELAVALYDQGSTLFLELDDSYHESRVLTDLGDAYLALGRQRDASEAWQRALTILLKLEHPDQEKVKSRIAGHHSQQT